MLFPFSTNQGVHDLPCILIFVAFWILIVHTIKSRTADITLNKAADIPADNNFYERQPIDRTFEHSSTHPRRHSMSIRDQSSVSQLPSIESKSSANIICRHVTRHPTAAGPYPRTSIHLGGIPKFCLSSSASALLMLSLSLSLSLSLLPSLPSLPPSLSLSLSLSFSLSPSLIYPFSLSFSHLPFLSLSLSIARIGT